MKIKPKAYYSLIKINGNYMVLVISVVGGARARLAVWGEGGDSGAEVFNITGILPEM